MMLLIGWIVLFLLECFIALEGLVIIKQVDDVDKKLRQTQFDSYASGYSDGKLESQIHASFSESDVFGEN